MDFFDVLIIEPSTYYYVENQIIARHPLSSPCFFHADIARNVTVIFRRLGDKNRIDLIVFVSLSSILNRYPITIAVPGTW